MKKQTLRIVVLLVLGVAAIISLTIHFNHVKVAQAEELRAIMELQAFNNFQHRVVAARGDANEMALQQMQALSEARAQATGLEHQIKMMEDNWKISDAVARQKVADEIAERKRQDELNESKLKLLEALNGNRIQ